MINQKLNNTLKTIIKEGNYYIIIVNRPNIILKVNNHNEIVQENGEHLLFHIRIINDGYYLENPFLNINNTTEDNINNLNYKLWYVIGNNKNIQNQYYLCQNDIIRFGNIKLLVKEINIKNINNKYYKNLDLNYNIYEINKKLNTNFESNIKLYLSNDNLNECIICKSNTSDENNPLITLCEYYIYKHFICLKNELNNEIKIVKNKNGNSINYFIKFHCNNCKIQLPLRFKIYGINKIFELIDIEKPKNEEYLLFESFDYLNFYNYYQRSIHLIKLIGNDNIINIKIGRDGYNKDNDIKLEEEAVSMEHVLIFIFIKEYISKIKRIIEYNKEEGILLLKNIRRN